MNSLNEFLPDMVVPNTAVRILATEGLDDVLEFLVLTFSHDEVQLHPFHAELYKPARCLSKHQLILIRNDHALLDQGHH